MKNCVVTKIDDEGIKWYLEDWNGDTGYQRWGDLNDALRVTLKEAIEVVEELELEDALGLDDEEFDPDDPRYKYDYEVRG